MAVPKKKISFSRKKTRFNSFQLKTKKYSQCNLCFNFIELHRICSCNIDSSSTNILTKYSN